MAVLYWLSKILPYAHTQRIITTKTHDLGVSSSFFDFFPLPLSHFRAAKPEEPFLSSAWNHCCSHPCSSSAVAPSSSSRKQVQFFWLSFFFVFSFCFFSPFDSLSDHLYVLHQQFVQIIIHISGVGCSFALLFFLPLTQPSVHSSSSVFHWRLSLCQRWISHSSVNVVVGVKLDSKSRELLTWALVKVAGFF